MGNSNNKYDEVAVNAHYKCSTISNDLDRGEAMYENIALEVDNVDQECFSNNFGSANFSNNRKKLREINDAMLEDENNRSKTSQAIVRIKPTLSNTTVLHGKQVESSVMEPSKAKKKTLSRTLSDPSFTRTVNRMEQIPEIKVDVDKDAGNPEKKSFGKRMSTAFDKTNANYDKVNETLGKVEELGEKIGFEISPLSSVGGGASADAAAAAPTAPIPQVGGVSGGGAPPPGGSGVSSDTAMKASSLVILLALGSTIVVALHQINTSFQNHHHWEKNTTEEFLDMMYKFGEYYRTKSESRDTDVHNIIIQFSNVSNESPPVLETPAMLPTRDVINSSELAALKEKQSNLGQGLESLSLNITDRLNILQKLIANLSSDTSEITTRLNKTDRLMDQLSEAINETIEEVKKPDLTCPVFGYNFPRDRQITDYVRYESYIPRLFAATFCMWVRAKSLDKSVLLSYAVNVGSDNELTFRIRNSSLLEAFVKGVKFNFPVPNLVASPERQHFCFTFSTREDEVAVYVNGIKRGSHVYRRSFTLAGGSLIIGQEQDEQDAKRLDPEQAFQGRLENYLIWPRKLNNEEIENLYQLCHCPQDFLVKPTLDRVRLYGNANYFIPRTCPVP
ncbi:uncharacterized protein LOC143469798 [Clavelina lepadiformis]|uniref:uncharacterized protein LOC143469798 n=1 Tax=Clavelina lepadiformis TaxID=159417 RepID=UPI0040421B6F